jgi:hypothetical protein
MNRRLSLPRPKISRPSVRRPSMLRIGALAVGAAAIVGGIAIDHVRPVVATPNFGVPLDHPMPYLVDKAAAGTWFCSGVPATAPGLGMFSIFNPTESPIGAVIDVAPLKGTVVRKTLSIPVRGRVDVSSVEAGVADFAAATVEINGVGGIVEQLSVSPEGTTTSACASAASSSWFLAEGSTALGDSLTLTLYNPYAADAIVDLSFADEEGPRKSKKFEGRVVPARSVVVFLVGEVIQRKRIVSVAADVRSGLVVMGRHQVYGGQDSKRRGVANGVAMASASTSWRFGNNQKGGDPPAAERLVIFNPNDVEMIVNATVLPADAAAENPVVAPPAPAIDPATGDADPAAGAVAARGPAVPEPLTVTVGAKQVGEIDLNLATAVKDGVYSIVVSSASPVVVERVLDRVVGGAALTSIQAGSRLTSTRWYVAAPPGPASVILYVLNATGDTTKSTFSVKAIGPAGAVAVPGLEEVPIAPGERVRVDLGEKNVGGEMLLIEGVTSLVVERVITTTGASASASISASLGVPVVAA